MLLKNDLIRHHVLTLSCFAMMLLAFARQELQADDLVFLKKSAIVSRSRYTGKIEDYNAIKLTLVNPSGKKLEIDSSRISHIETEFSSQKLKADRLFKEKKFGLAFDEYEEAIPSEKREWIRREIISKQILCLSAQQKTVSAISLFLDHFSSYPNTRFLHVAPLNWDPINLTVDVQNKCASILSGNPLEQLIASSWLLSGSQKGVAIKNLEKLARIKPQNEIQRRVVQWATMQLWRTRIDQSTKEDADSWKAEIQNLLIEDRVGPIIILGTLLSRLEQYDAAAIELMKIPILYPDRYLESAFALDLAADALTQNGKSKEAQLVLQELTNDYTTTTRARNRQNRAAGNQKKINNDKRP